MATHIPIHRIRDDAEFAEYHFGHGVWEPDPDKPRRRRQVLTEIGRVRISKRTGEITFSQTVSERVREAHEACVTYKLRQAFAAGEFPENIDYCS